MPFNKVDREKVLEQIDLWNKHYPLNTKVRVDGYSEVKATRTAAMLLFNKKPVIYLEGHNGYFDLDAVSPVEPVEISESPSTEDHAPVAPSLSVDSRLCFMFPGQGSQQKGMGEELFDEFVEMTQIADDVLGYSIRDLCLNDADQLLGQTQYTQPALFVVNAMTFHRMVREQGARPGSVLGHSLGEYSALYAAGAFDFETGLRLVNQRGALMAEATGGAMAAIIGMDADQVRKVLSDRRLDTIDLANINSPGQTVISGLKDDVERAQQEFEDAGARMVIPLPVSGAFHSRQMTGPQAGFRRFLDEFTFSPPELQVISNVEARPYDPERIQGLLADQLTSPVRWSDSIAYLESQGVGTFREAGPGNVLTGILTQIRRMKGASVR